MQITTSPQTSLKLDIGIHCINLLKVSERPKRPCMARALTPMEILLEEIRTPPTLRSVRNRYTTSDSDINDKKKLIPSTDLAADLSEEVGS